MSYYDSWELANNQDFLARCGICAEQEGLGYDWGVEHRFAIASAPGFGEAWASAKVGLIGEPGRNPAVISDGMILSAVQAEASKPHGSTK